VGELQAWERDACHGSDEPPEASLLIADAAEASAELGLDVPKMTDFD
jgi:hypothetical protein